MTKPARGRLWYAGWNEPGQMPERKPNRFVTWEEAHQFILATIGEWFTQDQIESGYQGNGPMGRYVEASAALRTVRRDEPYSLFYEGQVVWVADLPL